MCGLWAGLVLAGVSPFMPCSSCSQIERSLLFFFFQLILHRLYFCGRRVRSFAIWQSDRNKFTNRKKTGLRTQNGWPKKTLVQDTWSKRERGHPLAFFSSNDKQSLPSEEREESKEVQESKGKGIFFSRLSNRWRLPSLLDRRSQKSRLSLTEPWFGLLLRLSLGKTPALSFFQEMLS